MRDILVGADDGEAAERAVDAAKVEDVAAARSIGAEYRPVSISPSRPLRGSSSGGIASTAWRYAAAARCSV